MATTLYELSQRECEDLLRAGTTARVAFVAPDGPHIVPLNYTVVGDDIVVRTARSSLFGTHGPGSIVALEIDGLDTAREQGWSVVVRGRAATIDDARTLAALRTADRPRPWVAGRRATYIRVRWDEVSGRRIGAGWSVVATWPFSMPWVGALTRFEWDEGFRLLPREPRRSWSEEPRE